MCQMCLDSTAVHAAPMDYGAGPATSADPTLIADVATANHILVQHKVLDAFGHVSARHDKRPDRFLLARSMAPGLVTQADIMEFELDGTPVNQDGRRVYLERFIHGEIYRLRPDVTAIVHSHSASVVPFSVVPSVPLRAVFHMAGFIGTTTPIFEIRDHAGPSSDLLIRSPDLGVALARALGSAPLILMRGHGSTVVAPTLKLAVYRAVYAEINARLQADALRLGPVTYLTEGEGQSTAAANAAQIERAWDLWVAEVRAAGDA
jgi:ribulose-5-phosphate 4-epimerase/fuculose-1-phosphate aldolase